MRTGNPVLKEKYFETSVPYSESMTINGVVNKSAILLAVVFLSALWIWNKFYTANNPASITPYLWVGVFGGLIAALVTTFKPVYAHITAPIYALLEGFALGGISAFMESAYPGIVLQAVSLTFATFFTLLVAYRSGWIKVTENFRMMVVAATGGIFLVYVIDIVVSFFGISLPFIYEGGFWGILFSLFVVGIAAMNLVLDFDFIEQGVQKGSPKYMEWYASFGLLVTLVWLYIEILRLIAKSRR